MKASDFRKVILFMANQWSKETAIAIFGKVMGEHFWSKWVGNETPDHRTMRLFYEMSDTNLQVLIDYVKTNYNG
jgi:hypothetical protein